MSSTSPSTDPQKCPRTRQPRQEGLFPQSTGVGAVRTLIVDDSPFGLRALERILEDEGAFSLVGTAANGEEAVLQVMTLRPELVLMDYRMPHVNGIEATRRIKQLPNPPLVVIVSSEATPELIALADTAGANGFVDKGADFIAQMRWVLRDVHSILSFNREKQ